MGDCEPEKTRKEMKDVRVVWIVGLLMLTTHASPAQDSLLVEQPQPLTLLGLSVYGLEDASMQSMILRTSGLQEGQRVAIPGGAVFAEAIRGIYRLGLFSDIRILEEKRVGTGVYLRIDVKTVPRIANYTFHGVKKKHRSDLKKDVPMFRGGRALPGTLSKAEQTIRTYYAEKGHLHATIETKEEILPNGNVHVHFHIDPRAIVEVRDVRFLGNEQVSDRRLSKRMKATKEDKWWRLFKKASFERTDFEADLANVLAYYHDQGYYDAQIVSDSVYVNAGGLVIDVTVREGARYAIRSIAWEGNTLFTDIQLEHALGFRAGDQFNQARLDQNLYGNARSSDVASLYLNRGYLQFRVEPTIRVVAGDSLDLHFDVYEGDMFAFGDITIAGNLMTKDHVIRRELYTVPGSSFSREAISESIRRLMQLNYFSQESIAAGPSVQRDDLAKKANLIYTLAETNTTRLSLSGTWTSTGPILNLGLGLTNFSLANVFKRDGWRPLPMGDGQQLSVDIQAQGRAYQRYGLSFTEPWFRGRPRPLGFSLSYTRFDESFYAAATNDGLFTTTSASVFFNRRLQWPDDKFSSASKLTFTSYTNDGILSSLPAGRSQELTVRQGISRNSLNHPVFATAGSQTSLTVDIALPLPDFIQYHKWRFQSQWNLPLSNKVAFTFGTDLGYIGSLTGDPVAFQRFDVGGSPFDTQGFTDGFGKEVIYMRGYPRSALGPRLDGEAIGGRILNKYTSELRWMAVQTPSLQAMPYLFYDAANAWRGFNDYDPSNLFQSAGLGVRMNVPMLGLVELAYGYRFNTFEPLGNDSGAPKWGFQFSLGRGF